MGIKKCRHRARNCYANRSGVFQYPHMKEADAEELMNYAVRHWDPFCAVAIKNYIRIGRFSLWYAYYAIIDVPEYYGDQLFIMRYKS